MDKAHGLAARATKWPPSRDWLALFALGPSGCHFVAPVALLRSRTRISTFAKLRPV